MKNKQRGLLGLEPILHWHRLPYNPENLRQTSMSHLIKIVETLRLNPRSAIGEKAKNKSVNW